MVSKGMIAKDSFQLLAFSHWPDVRPLDFRLPKGAVAAVHSRQLRTTAAALKSQKLAAKS
jgi:hypothetical protein